MDLKEVNMYMFLKAKICDFQNPKTAVFEI